MSFRSFYNARKKKYESGIPDGPLENTGVKTKQTGTTVRFKPDPAVFSETNFSLDTVEERLNELAFLNRGLEITLIDERITMADAKRMRGNLEADDDSADEENAAESGESAEEIAAEKEDKKRTRRTIYSTKRMPKRLKKSRTPSYSNTTAASAISCAVSTKRRKNYILRPSITRR